MQKPKVPMTTIPKKQFIKEHYGYDSYAQYRNAPDEVRNRIEGEWIRYLRKNDPFWVEEYDQYIIDLRTYYVMKDEPLYMGVKKRTGLVLGCMHDDRRVLLMTKDALKSIGRHPEIYWIPVQNPLTVEDEFEFVEMENEHGDKLLYLKSMMKGMVNDD